MSRLEQVHVSRNEGYTRAVLVPRSFFFFFFFFGFVSQGQDCCETSAPVPLQSRGLSAPTNLHGSPHSLEFSLKV